MSKAHARQRRRRGAVLDARNRQRRRYRRNIAALRRLSRAFKGAASAATGVTKAMQKFSRVCRESRPRWREK